jgi:hypothetical protein
VPLSRLLSWRGFLLAFVAICLLAWADRTIADRAARRASPTGGADWIWQDRYHRDVSPTAFYAARDFFLESVPATARLLVAADEEYLLTLNNRPVGRGGSPHQGRLDAYEVGPLLQEGGNRLVAELRSARGQGGFLLYLQDPATGKELMGSGAKWRLFDRALFGLERGWQPLDDGAEPRVWGGPPIGRWGKLAPPVERQTEWVQERNQELGREGGLSVLSPSGGPDRGIAAGRPPSLPSSFRANGPGGSGLEPEAPASPAVTSLDLPLIVGGTPVKGAGTLVDFGREVSGVLRLDLPPAADLGVALLYFGSATAPDMFAARPDGAVLVVPGKKSWEDAHSRRFRYALLVGLGRPVSVRLLPGKPSSIGVEKRENGGGVFGVRPPPSRTPVEDEVWRKLQRVAGVGGGEKL